MSDVAGVKARYDRFDRNLKFIVVGSYFFSMLSFFLLVQTATLDQMVALSVTVIMIPLVISLFAENHRMRLIMNISIELLRYIDENYPNVEIPLGGKKTPLGTNHDRKEIT